MNDIAIDKVPVDKTTNPKREKMSQPEIVNVVFIDDNRVFLKASELTCGEFYEDKVRLFTIYANEDANIIEELREILNKHRVDTIYIDEDMPGQNGPELLKNLKDTIKSVAYTPVVVMTAHAENMDEAPSLDTGALRYIYKFVGADDSNKNALQLFLQQAFQSVSQLRGQMEDNIWAEVTGEIADQLAHSQSLRDVIDWAGAFLKDHFGACAFYVREHDGQCLKLMGGVDSFGIGDALNIKAIPYLDNLLNSGGLQHFRSDGLTKADLGTVPAISKLLNYRALATPLVLNRQRLGTIALYREPERHPFRAKDETFLRHVALQVAASLGAERELTQLRDRQTKLVEFVHTASTANDEDTVLQQLVNYLHQEIQDGDGTNAKCTIRLIVPGTDRIPRRCYAGLPPTQPDDGASSIKNIHSGYARVILHRKSEVFGNVTIEAREKGFIFTHPDIHSALTVPLVSSGLCLGAVNMEDRRPNQYNQYDQAFAESLAGVATTVLMQLKAQRFLTGLLELVNDLVDLKRPASSEDLLSKAFLLLHDFVGYARLLYLVPEKDFSAPWRVGRVVGSDGCMMLSDEITLWNKQIGSNWLLTYLYKFLFGKSTEQYTEVGFLSDTQLGVDTQSMMVSPLYFNGTQAKNSHPDGILSLLFLTKGAVNPFQTQLIQLFGQFVGTLLRLGDSARKLLGEISIERQQAVIGQVLGQFRHKLRTHLGLVGNALDDGRHEGNSGDWLDRAQDILQDIDLEINNAKYLVKVPQPSPTDLSIIISEILRRFRFLVEKKGILLDNWQGEQPLVWNTDEQVIGAILEYLLQNACEQCSTGDRIWITTKKEADWLLISVCDTGPGVPPAVKARLFEPGITTRPGGTGYGLYISRIRARDLSGDLHHADNVKKGAVFTLRLPATPNQQEG